MTVPLSTVPTPIDFSPEGVLGVNLPVGHEKVTACVSHRMGLMESSGRFDIKSGQLQERVNESLGKLHRTLVTNDHLSAHLAHSASGEPVIHAITVYRSGNKTPTHYDMTQDSDLERLLRESGLPENAINAELIEEKKGLLIEIAREFDGAFGEISPSLESPLKFDEKHIGDLNGTDLGTLFNNNYDMRKVMQKALEDPKNGMVNPANGRLNEHGARALKEMAAVSFILGEKQEQLQNLRSQPPPPNFSEGDRRRLQEKIKEAEHELKVLETSQLAVNWMIIKLNAPLPLPLYKRNNDGSITSEEMTVRKAIAVEPGVYFTDDQATNPLDPRLLRNAKADQSSREFEAATSSGKQAALGVGAFFFYGGEDQGREPCLRIDNIAYHEKHRVAVTRDIPEANDLIKDAHEAVTPTSNSPVAQKVKDLDQLTTAVGDQPAIAKGWTEMRPKDAIAFLRDQKIGAPDERGRVKKALSRKAWRR